MRHSENLSVRLSNSHRKYSLGLLEEAFILSNKIGVRQAAQEAGINVNSLVHYRLIRRRELGCKKQRPYVRNNAMDPAKKRACYLMFKRLHEAKFGGKRKCWIEAGNRTGVNGRSVEMQVTRGIWAP